MVAAGGKNCLHSSSTHDGVPLLLPAVKCPKLRLRIRRGLEGGDYWHGGAQPNTEKIQQLPSNHHRSATSTTTVSSVDGPTAAPPQQDELTVSHAILQQPIKKPSHNHHHHHITLRSARLASSSRPLSTYTSLGSRRVATTSTTALPTTRAGGRRRCRARSKSMGNYPEATATTTTTTSASPSSSLDTVPSTTPPGGHHHHHTRTSPPAAAAAHTGSSHTASSSGGEKALLRTERERTRRLQAAEAHCSADALRTILQAERLRMEQHIIRVQQQQHTATTATQNTTATNNNSGSSSSSSSSSTSAEVLEAEVLVEGQLDGMMQHLDILQAEKGRLAAEIRREEEWMQTTLQARLAQVLHSNATLRRKIEAHCKVNECLQEELATTAVATAATQSSHPAAGRMVYAGRPSTSSDTDVVMDEEGSMME